VRIFWTPYAISSLKHTVNFLSEHWSETVIEKFLDQVDHYLFLLIQNPEMSPVLISGKYRRLLIHKNISLFYTVNYDLIKILLVWDNRQDPEILHKLLMRADHGNY